jgi:hypothetical protein
LGITKLYPDPDLVKLNPNNGTGTTQGPTFNSFPLIFDFLRLRAAAVDSFRLCTGTGIRYHISVSQMSACYFCNRYEKIAKIGQGTFGEVFKAKCKTDKNKIVALKKVLMENEKEVKCISNNQGCGSGSGSGSRRAKITHKKRKKVNKFHVLNCWMFSFEG